MPQSSMDAEMLLDAPASGAGFLATHRALAVCSREFSRLSATLVANATTYARSQGLDAPTTRCTPDRCIVQLGPVALTVAWLKNGNASPAAGQLLSIVWRGVIAPRGEHAPERLGWRRVPPTPVSEWEATHVVSADSEATWRWHPESVDHPGLDTPALSALCVAQLCRSLDAFRAEEGLPHPVSPS